MGSQNPVPALLMPMPNSVSDPKQVQNNQALVRWAKTVSPRMLAIDTLALTGGPSPTVAPDDCYLMITGTPTKRFTAGVCTLTFPQPFPNTIVSVQITSVNVTYLWNYGLSGGASVIFLSAVEPDGTVPSGIDITFSYTAIGY